MAKGDIQPTVDPQKTAGKRGRLGSTQQMFNNIGGMPSTSLYNNRMRPMGTLMDRMRSNQGIGGGQRPQGPYFGGGGFNMPDFNRFGQ